MIQKAVILCGGMGSRFLKISASPKILAPFGQDRFLDYLIRYLKGNGIKEIILSTGYRSNDIQDYLRTKNYSGVKLIKEAYPLGTGGAVINVVKNLQSPNRILILNGDTFWQNPIPSNLLLNDINVIDLASHNVAINTRYGEITVKEKKISISLGSQNEPRINSTVFSGLVSLPLNIIPKEELHISLEDLLLAQNGKCDFRVTEIGGSVIDFGTPEGYKRLSQIHEV